jgi:hypothetical protein
MDKNTLVIADQHHPFCHKDYLPFCIRIYKAFKCNRVVNIGDVVDNHAISFHTVDPDGFSPADEMKEVDKKLIPWFKAFPEMWICRGNHDNLVDRKSKHVGLPSRAFKNFRDIWCLPDKWHDGFEWEFDNVVYKHGTGYSGKHGHVQAAIDARQSCVIGHLHSSAGVQYLANEKEVLFGMNVGSGIDRHKYAFAYGKDFRCKPILSCGIVSGTKYGVNAQVIPMKMK